MTDPEHFKDFTASLKLCKTIGEFKDRIYFFIMELPINRIMNINSFFDEKDKGYRKSFIQVLEHLARKSYGCFDLEICNDRFRKIENFNKIILDF